MSEKYQAINEHYSTRELTTTGLIVDYTEERSCFQRTFGKMEPGCERSTTISLTISAMGSGLLALPCIDKVISECFAKWNHSAAGCFVFRRLYLLL